MSKLTVPNEASEALKQSVTITSLPILWGDQDAFGHVNNVIHFKWFETARADLLNAYPSSLKLNNSGLGPILASVNCDYRRQLHYPDIVHIGCHVSRVGRSSFDVRHVLYSEKLNAIAAEGVSVLVVFDYQANRPVRIPDDLRLRFEAASNLTSLDFPTSSAE